jgi:hypothetical protein
MKGRALDGNFSAEDAVRALTRGSRLKIELKDGSILLRGRASTEDEAAGTSSSEIVVTGSRLRGAPIASPVIKLSRRDITDSGQVSMGDVVRTIPRILGAGKTQPPPSTRPVRKGTMSARALRSIFGAWWGCHADPS